MKSMWKRSLSLFLAVVMIMGNIPVNALATGTDEIIECTHANAEVTEFSDATCGEDGCAVYYCADCEEGWEETISATGNHSYDSSAFDGVVVYTCRNCGDTYEEVTEEEPVEEQPAVSSFGLTRAVPELSGVAWIDADSDTTVADLLGVAVKGGIRDAVLRAVNLYDPEEINYTVYCTVDGTRLDVGSARVLYANQQKAEKLAEEMRGSVTAEDSMSFELEGNDGSVYIANIRLRSFKNLEDNDISLNVTEAYKTAPDGLQALIEGKVDANVIVNGLSRVELEELEQCITVVQNAKTYTLPNPGAKDNVYSNVISATVTEGMTGRTKTITGGTVTLRNNTPWFDVVYYATESDMEAGVIFDSDSQLEGYVTPEPAKDPTRTYYTFGGWLLVNEDNTISTEVGLAEKVTRDTKYVAKWIPEVDEHTPGAVEGNGTGDGIDDREQSFVVTYFDADSSEVIFTKEVAYNTNLKHPSKDEATAALQEKGLVNELGITDDSLAFKQWKHAGGQTGFVIMSNAAYQVVWEQVWVATYTNGYDGTVLDTVVVKNNAAFRHPADPVREGWEFTGWVYDGEGEAPTTATANATFKATWTKLHTITFINGYDDSVVDEVTLKDGETIVAPAAPTREGYVFAGWDMEEGAVASGDVTIEAKWLKVFTLTYTDGVDGAVFATFTRNVTEGDAIVPPAVPAQREGFIFNGWNVADGGEDSETANRDAIYSPVWVEDGAVVLCTITYTDGKDGGVFETFTVEAVKDSDVIHPDVPAVYADHDFGGWKQVASDSATGDATYEAIWNKRPVLTYTDGVENEEVFEDFSVSVNYGSTISHPKAVEIPKRDGYDFFKWERTDGTTPTIAISDGTYKAIWKLKITFTDGVEDSNVFADFTLSVEEGSELIYPKVPAHRSGYTFNGWEQVDAVTYKATWLENQVTVTLIDGDKEIVATVENGETLQDESLYSYETGSTNKKIKLGWYPVVTINEKEYVRLGYKAAARTLALNDNGAVQDETVIIGDDGSINVLLVDEADLQPGEDRLMHVAEYVRTHTLPDPVDMPAEKITDHVTYQMITLPDEDKNGVIDGMCEIDEATGEAKTDENGEPVLAEGAASTVYRYYNAKGDTVLTYLEHSVDGLQKYDVAAANYRSVKAVDGKNDGIICTDWVCLDADGVKENDHIIVYYLKALTEDDANNNNIFDANETVGIMVSANGANPVSYTTWLAEDKGNKDILSVVLTAAAESKKAPDLTGNTFVMDTANGTNIEVSVDPDKGYYLETVEFANNYEDTNGKSELVSSGDNTQKYKLTDTAPYVDDVDRAGDAEYYVTISIKAPTVQTSNLYVGGDRETLAFTKQEVYEAVVEYPVWNANAKNDVQYVARAYENNTVTVSIEALFQWLKDNYGSTLLDSMEEELRKQGMDGVLNTDANGNHILTIDVEEDVLLPVDAVVDPEVKTAQDIANEHINAYINRFVEVMKSDPANRTEADPAPLDMIFEMAALMTDIGLDVEENADILPFAYNAAGAASMEETVYISVDDKPVFTETVNGKEVSKAIPVAITDKRTPSGIAAAKDLVSDAKLVYGVGNVDTFIMDNVTASVTGLKQPVSYAGQSATTYDNVSVMFPGSVSHRPGRVTFSVKIGRAEAAVDVPALILKEHNTDYTGKNNPAPSNPKGADIISVIAGMDLNSMDIDLQKDENNPVTFKGTNAKAWVKLSNNLLNLIELAKEIMPNSSQDPNEQKLIDLVKKFKNSGTATYPLDDAVAILKALAQINENNHATINKVINKLTAATEGTIEVTLSATYPEDPGVYLNMAIVSDANYVHGVNESITGGKEYGLILVSPVLTMPNNGVQLISEEQPEEGRSNVFTFDHDGNAHALTVEGHADTVVYYYGFNSELAVHYNGGTTAPTKPGAYLASTVVTKTVDGAEKVCSDMAVILIGVEGSSLGITETLVPYDGKPHEATITVYDENDNPVTAGKTVITARVEKKEAGLSGVKGIVNMNLPSALDNAWASAVSYMEGKVGKDLPNDIQDVVLSPEHTREFLNWCKTRVAAKDIDGKLASWHVPESLLESHSPQGYAIRILDELIAAVDKIINRTSGDVVSIQFKNNNQYTDYGVYLYYAIVTDTHYLPSHGAGYLVIHAEEESFQMDNQTVPYTGEGQIPVITDETGHDSFMAIYNDKAVSFVFNGIGDDDALLKKLKAKGVRDGMTVHALLENGVDEISSWIVEGLIARGDQILSVIHKDDSVTYNKLKGRLEAHVAYRETEIVAGIEAMLNDISSKVDGTTKLYFNKKPVDPGKYQVHAFSYAIGHEEATFTILPVITIKAEDQTIFQGDDISRDQAQDAIYAVNPADTEITLPKDLSNVTFSVYTIKEENGKQVKDALVSDVTALEPGTYFIEVTADEKKDYFFEFETGTLVVEQMTDITVTAESNEISVGETVKLTYKVSKEVDGLNVTLAVYKAVEEEGKLVPTGDPVSSNTAELPAGTYVVVPSVAEMEGYTVTTENGTLIINKIPVTIEVENQTIDYGTNIVGTKYTVKAGNEIVTDLAVTLEVHDAAGKVDDVTKLDPGTYSIVAVVADTAKYDVPDTVEPGTLTINKIPVTIEVENQTIDYGTNIDAAKYTVKAGETTITDLAVTLEVHDENGKVADVTKLDPGTYSIVAVVADSTKYDVPDTVEPGTLTINKISVTIEVEDQTIDHGTDFDNTKYAVKAGNEIITDLAVTLEVYDGETKVDNVTELDPGEYTIVAVAEDTDRYDVSDALESGKLTINKIKATVTALSFSLKQGESAAELYYVVTDAQNRVIPENLRDFTVTLRVMDGNNDVTDKIETLAAGDYDIIVETSESETYEITPVHGTLTIEAPSGKQKLAIYVTVNGRDGGVKVPVNEMIGFDYNIYNQDTGKWMKIGDFDGEYFFVHVFDENGDLFWANDASKPDVDIRDLIATPGKYTAKAVMVENKLYEQVDVDGTPFEIVEEEVEEPEDIVITLRADTKDYKIGETIVLSHTIRDSQGKVYTDAELGLTVTYQVYDGSECVYDSSTDNDTKLQALNAEEGTYTIVPVCDDPANLEEGYTFAIAGGALRIRKTDINITTYINGSRSLTVAVGADPSEIKYSTDPLPSIEGIVYGNYVVINKYEKIVDLVTALNTPGEYKVKISVTIDEEHEDFIKANYNIYENEALLKVTGATIFARLNGNPELKQDVKGATVVNVTYDQLVGTDFDLNEMVSGYEIKDANGNAIPGITTVEEAKQVVGTYYVYPILADSVDASLAESITLQSAVMTVDYVVITMQALIDHTVAKVDYFFGQKQTTEVPEEEEDESRWLNISTDAYVNQNHELPAHEYWNFAKALAINWNVTDNSGKEVDVDDALAKIGLYTFQPKLAEQQAETWDPNEWDAANSIYGGKYHITSENSTMKIKPFKTKPIVVFEDKETGEHTSVKEVNFSDDALAILETIKGFAGDYNGEDSGLVTTYLIRRLIEDASTYSLRRSAPQYEDIGYGDEKLLEVWGAGTFILIPVYMDTDGKYKTFDGVEAMGNYEIDTAEYATLVIEPMKVTIETTSKIEDLKVISGATAESVAQYFDAIVKNTDGEEIETTGLLNGFIITDSDGNTIDDTTKLEPGTYYATAAYTNGNYIVTNEVNKVAFEVVSQDGVRVSVTLSKNSGNYHMYGSNEWNWKVDANVVAKKNADIVQIPGLTANSYTIAKDGQPYDNEVSIESHPGSYVYTPVIPAYYKNIPYDDATFVQGKFRTTVETLVNYQSEYNSFIGVDEDEIKFTESYRSGPAERKNLIKEFVIKNASDETVNKETAMSTEGVYTIEVIYNESALDYIEVTAEEFATLTVLDPADVYVQANLRTSVKLVGTDPDNVRVSISSNASIPGLTNEHYFITDENGEIVESLEDALSVRGVYTVTPDVPEEFKNVITDLRSSTLTVVDIEDLAAHVYVNNVKSATVVAGGEASVRIDTKYETPKAHYLLTLPGVTYIIKNAKNEIVEAEKDAAGAVTKTALEVALETPGKYTIEPEEPDGSTKEFKSKNPAELTVISLEEITVTATVSPDTVTVGATTTVKIKASYGNVEVTIPGLTNDSYTVWEGETQLEDTVENGVVTETALSKALNKAGTYEIRPVAPDGVKAENVKSATLTVTIAGEIIPSSIDATLRMRSEVQVNVFFKVKGFEGLNNITENMGLLVWKDNSRPMDECDITNADYIQPLGEIDVETGDYVVRSHGISAKDMGDDLWFKIYVKADERTYVYSPRFKYSPKTYCINALKDTNAEDSLKALCVALMNYGADAQEYLAEISEYTYTKLMNEETIFDENQYRVNAFSTSMITPLSDKDSSKHGEFVYTAGYLKSASPYMSFKGALSLNYTINCINTSYTEAGLLVWNEKTYNSVDTLTWENAVQIRSNTVGSSTYDVRHTGIAAKDMGGTVYACAYVKVDGEYKYSGIFVYSIEEFAKNVIQENQTGTFRDVMETMVVYGDHAKNYFANN